MYKATKETTMDIGNYHKLRSVPESRLEAPYSLIPAAETYNLFSSAGEKVKHHMITVERDSENAVKETGKGYFKFRNICSNVSNFQNISFIVEAKPYYMPVCNLNLFRYFPLFQGAKFETPQAMPW